MDLQVTSTKNWPLWHYQPIHCATMENQNKKTSIAKQEYPQCATIPLSQDHDTQLFILLYLLY